MNLFYLEIVDWGFKLIFLVILKLCNGMCLNIFLIDILF